MAKAPPTPNDTGASAAQFSLRMLFLITLVIAVSAATWGGLTRQGANRLLFIFFGAAAPFGVLVLVGVTYWWRRRRRRR